MVFRMKKILILFMTVASSIPAHALPEWVPGVKQAEAAENVGLYVAGMLTIALLWWLVAFVRRHWKEIFIVCGVVFAVASVASLVLIILAL